MNDENEEMIYEHTEAVDTEFEHNLQLLGKIDSLTEAHFKNVFSFCQKVLALSNISAELAQLYALKIECAKEWFDAGLKELALKRISYVYDRLMLNRSVTGFERTLQGAKVRVNVGARLRPGEPTELEPEEEEEEKPGLIDRLRGRGEE